MHDYEETPFSRTNVAGHRPSRPQTQAAPMEGGRSHPGMVARGHARSGDRSAERGRATRERRVLSSTRHQQSMAGGQPQKQYLCDSQSVGGQTPKSSGRREYFLESPREAREGPSNKNKPHTRPSSRSTNLRNVKRGERSRSPAQQNGGERAVYEDAHGAGVKGPSRASYERQNLSHRSPSQMHDSVGSVIHKQHSPLQQGLISLHQLQQQQHSSKTPAKPRRSCSWDIGSRDSTANADPRKLRSNGPRAKGAEKPKQAVRSAKKAGSVQQKGVFTSRVDLNSNGDRPQHPRSRSRADGSRSPFPPQSPEPGQRPKSQVGRFDTKMKPRISGSDSRFDAMRTAPDLRRTFPDFTDIMQTTDLMNTGGSRWDFLQSADVRWDVHTEDFDDEPRTPVQTPWINTARTVTKHRSAVSLTNTVDDGAKQGLLKNFLGKMLVGCCRPVDVANEGMDVSNHAPPRMVRAVPHQDSGRQSTTLGRFASRQRFMVNMIEEGRFHPGSVAENDAGGDYGLQS